ncbi:IucA/IucC family protein [Marinobacter sp. SS21]|uniref:IucA/IucC family protein n=1 Tax=Marinobacter sp. SS21 TaxID=2979460 RepID=UPI00233041EF|nr:IucA/IucC family protein [Marinobacter sp. SS21]MDC0661663.1 IucA/IucC family protein [Marinobacter sp. SS21]
MTAFGSGETVSALSAPPSASQPGIERRAAVDYVSLRLIDTLLREDAQGLIARSQLLPSAGAPFTLAQSLPEGAHWLCYPLADRTSLWFLVNPGEFMQSWRSAAGVVMHYHPEQGAQWVPDYRELLARLAVGLPEEAAGLYTDYAHECDVAVSHRLLCEAERRRWFNELQHQGDAWPAANNWSGRFLFYDRLAAFLDHPFYPSARAKLGFGPRELAAYAPEFQQAFELRWLAVPSSLFEGTLDQVPEYWPSFAKVGLSPELQGCYQLVPVHPALWHAALDGYLQESGLDGEVIRAPESALRVRPTLSVRTLVIEADPGTHLKVPLTIRTLGSKNIRTVKPSTIGDGHRVQTVLRRIAADDGALQDRLLLTDEQRGGHVAAQNFLGFILRGYPAELANASLISVAGLLAEGADGRTTVEVVAAEFYHGDLAALWQEYLDLTLTLHLRLWLRYGIALESNQQNSMLVLESGQPLRLLLKDNDAPRIWLERLAAVCPELAHRADQLQDRRILADGEQALAQMFITISLQLNLAVPLEGLIARGLMDRQAGYRQLRGSVERQLRELHQEGLDTRLADEVLLQAERLPAKYLLRAGSLESKASTGAADINKFYGETAPNFLRQDVEATS